MTGWIIRNRASGQGSDSGEILGADARIYSFPFSAQPGNYSDLELKTCVSFSPLSENTADDSQAIIESVLQEAVDPEIADLDAKLQEVFSTKRYLHTFRVSKIARALAERFDYSPRTAEIAGLLHDIAKENPMEENLRIIQEAGLPITSFEAREHSVLHAAAGAVLAASRYGINDPDILGAIRYHNGRPAMKKLEKIIFLADHIDYVYKNGIRSLYSIVLEDDLDRATFRMFTTINRVLVKGGNRTDAITESTMNYMFVNLNGAAQSAGPASDTRTSIPDELFDRALEISSRRGLPIRSVKDIRELGGCALSDGRRVRRGMLVRAAQLTDMTAGDAAWLADFGVETIIDLRSDLEIRESPDRHTEGFRYIHCPLPTVELTEYQKNIQEKFFLTPPGEEKAYYLSEYLSCISMKELYMRILTEEDAVNSLRKVFDLLCEPDHGGFLIHCTSGKDRTGIVSALILLALGAPAEEIREDYYTSALATFSETEAFAQSLRKQRYSAAYIDEMRYYNGIGMNIAENTYEAVVSSYGSAENYLTDVLLSEEKIRLLRDRFTEECANDRGNG